MKYFIVLKVLYLMLYYSIILSRPSKFYALSVAIALVAATLGTLITIFTILFSRETKEFPFEALLFHGLSYEEWRTAKEVKQKMDKVHRLTLGEGYSPETVYLILLLTLGLFGLVEYRAQTPEEECDATLGPTPKEGDVLHVNVVNYSQTPIITRTVHTVGRDAAEFAGRRNRYVEHLKNTKYQGATLSRLLFDRVKIVFKRKKLGPRKSKAASSFIKTFGLATS